MASLNALGEKFAGEFLSVDAKPGMVLTLAFLKGV